MALIECPNGHLYNSDQYAACPYCCGGMTRVEFGADPDQGVGVAGPELGATVAPASYQARQQSDVGKTVAVFRKDFSSEPVAGWLVCIEGPAKGKDYRIAARNNSIGRGESMDICIKGDATISRENHARLSYDGKHNDFYLIPAESTNNTYINDEPVYVPTLLKKGDVIELGESKFIFVPFCDDVFNWRDGLKQDG